MLWRDAYARTHRMLAAEATSRHQALPVSLPLDWHSPDYFPRGRTGHHTGARNPGIGMRIWNFMDGQLRELLTNYGDIGAFWFDGMWIADADWHLARHLLADSSTAAAGSRRQQPSKNPFLERTSRCLRRICQASTLLVLIQSNPS